MFNILDNVVANGVEDPEKLSGWTSVGHILAAVANFFIAVGFSVSIIGLAYALVQFIMSRGDPKEMEKARHAILWTVVSAFVAILAVAIKNALFHALGVSDADLTNDNPGF